MAERRGECARLLEQAQRGAVAGQAREQRQGRVPGRSAMTLPAGRTHSRLGTTPWLVFEADEVDQSSMTQNSLQTTPGPRAWARSVTRPAQEFAATALHARSGELPDGLRGTLYRNGPALLERGGVRVGHWFDGDGAVLAVHFDRGTATATYRFVETEGLHEESEAGRLLYGGYGQKAPGPIWKQWERPVKNTANTSVLALPDRVLALWEGGWPHALDPETLATVGLTDLAGPGGQLRAGNPYSAHPKRDPETGDIYNFGVSIRGRKALLVLYRSNRSGALAAQSEYELDGAPLIHDFVLAGPYLVFLVPPVRIDLLSVVLGLKSYSEAMRWRPELGTGILVFRRSDLTLVARGADEAWFQWHLGNGAVATDRHGLLSLDFVRYEDFSTNRHLGEVATGRTETPARGTLWRLRMNPTSARVYELEELSDRSVEFPLVPTANNGRTWPATYLVAHRPGTDTTAERYDAIACFDYTEGALIEADLGDGRYPSEPMIVPDADGTRQWLLSVVFDGNADRSEVWIFDADALTAGPVCILPLPAAVPLGFHGCWRTAHD